MCIHIYICSCTYYGQLVLSYPNFRPPEISERRDAASEASPTSGTPPCWDSWAKKIEQEQFCVPPDFQPRELKHLRPKCGTHHFNLHWISPLLCNEALCIGWSRYAAIQWDQQPSREELWESSLSVPSNDSHSESVTPWSYWHSESGLHTSVSQIRRRVQRSMPIQMIAHATIMQRQRLTITMRPLWTSNPGELAQVAVSRISSSLWLKKPDSGIVSASSYPCR